MKLLSLWLFVQLSIVPSTTYMDANYPDSNMVFEELSIAEAGGRIQMFNDFMFVGGRVKSYGEPTNSNRFRPDYYREVYRLRQLEAGFQFAGFEAGWIHTFRPPQEEVTEDFSEGPLDSNDLFYLRFEATVDLF